MRKGGERSFGGERMSGLEEREGIREGRVPRGGSGGL